MRIYYDELAKNIVLGQANRLFATGSLEASEFRGRVSIVYKDTNFRELFIAHSRVLKEHGSPAGATLAEVLAYLNAEFVKTPFEGGGQSQLTRLAAENIIAYKLVTTDDSGQAIYLSAADTDHVGSTVGIATISALAGNSVTIQESGLVTNAGWMWTPKSLLYVGLDGDITTAQTGVFSQYVGYAVSATEILIRFGRPVRRA